MPLHARGHEKISYSVNAYFLRNLLRCILPLSRIWVQKMYEVETIAFLSILF
jgi:hypothetical protein